MRGLTRVPVNNPGHWSGLFRYGVAQESRDEILALFPEVATPAGLESYQAARLSLEAHEAKLLVEQSLR